jgi:hypothetical protein
VDRLDAGIAIDFRDAKGRYSDVPRNRVLAEVLRDSVGSLDVNRATTATI